MCPDERCAASDNVNAPFGVRSDTVDGLHAVSVSGELDQGTAPELRGALAEALADESRGFAVCCPDDDVRRLLELTGIDQAVGLFDSRDEAITTLTAGS